MKRRDFLAGAIFGSVACVTALKGEAVAGDSFGRYREEYQKRLNEMTDKHNELTKKIDSSSGKEIGRNLGLG